MIKRILLNICSSCQLRCELCVSQEMQEIEPHHQAELEDVVMLTNRLKVLGERVEELQINGPGEPLLWKHFNPAIRHFVQSGVIGRITLVTNALALKTIADDVWPHLHIGISRYPNIPIDEGTLHAHNMHHYVDYMIHDHIKVGDPPGYEIADRSTFIKVTGYPHAGFFGCACNGPTYFKRKILPHCGPPLFGAVRRCNSDPWQFAVDIQEWDPKKTYNMILPCRWCWANGAAARPYAEPHKMRLKVIEDDGVPDASVLPDSTSTTHKAD